MQFVFGQVCSLFQNMFSRECDLVLCLSSSSIFFSLKLFSSCCMSLSSCPFYLSFDSMFQKAVPMQDMANPLSLPSFYCFLLQLCHVKEQQTEQWKILSDRFSAGQKQHRKIEFVLDVVWFAYSYNIDSQNNHCCLEDSVQFLKLLHII